MSNVSEKRRKLFARLLQQEKLKASPDQIVPRKHESNICSASFAQQRLWFLDQMEPGSPVYNVPAAFRLKGHLNIAALEQSLSEIIVRHEALRTTFVSAEGLPMQVIAAPWRFVLPLVDLSQLARPKHEFKVEQLIQQEGRKPFDLARGPLVRGTLLRLSIDEHILLLTIHHTISDGWTLGVLLQELTATYQAYVAGCPSNLPVPTIQYRDYALWQREWLQGEILEKQLSYWKTKLNSASPLLELPTDHLRPATQTFRGASQPLALSAELVLGLKELSRNEGVTLFMTLMAALNTLLYRYTSQTDLLVGTPIANRHRVETEGVVGFFANTLVLRTKLSGELTFHELLAQVKQDALDAYAHQDLPFERLVEELHPERNLSRTPYFQVMFALQNTPVPPITLSDLSIVPLRVDTGTAKLDLMFYLEELPDKLSGWLEYNADIFDAATIENLVQHWQSILSDIVATPKKRISDISLLSEDEQRQLLVEWNDTHLDYLQRRGFHELFEIQTTKTPDAIAVVSEEHQLTYAELNRQANRVAHYLRQLGVGPEVLVGVCIERSLEMVVALLGVLKAGGAYVPLDPAYPQQRLRDIISDAKCKVLLTQSKLETELPPGEAITICLDFDREKLVQSEVTNPLPLTQSENLAYVIYTSGSTGKPKGVAITHRSVIAFISWASEIFSPIELAGVLASTSICFDLSIFELFVTLSCGGKVILAENAMFLPSLPSANEVTLINTVPSAITELVRLEAIPDSVVTINLAGEALQNTLAQRIYKHSCAQRLLNLYGPTEDTTYSTWVEVEKGSKRGVSIGRPLANTQAYIPSSALGPVPTGALGELYLGGDGLARGYLNRPELTAERFVPDSFGPCEGKRLYKTGDVARYLRDGQIDFLGRIDHQVKIRGYRIELGEIEAALLTHPAVREVVVLAREDRSGGKRIVAYYVCEAKGQKAMHETLRQHLREQLPEYMLPSVFVLMNELPLTPNGKVDRRSLPEPVYKNTAQENEETEPLTAIEEVLANIWAEVLHIKGVGSHDNFFDLGGHSLLATQVIAKVGQIFHVELPLRGLFETPTVAGLAQQLERAKHDQLGLKFSPLQPVSRDEQLQLSFAQQRLWFLDQLTPGNASYNMATTLRIEGPLNIITLEQSLREVIRRHESLRTTFESASGEPHQVISHEVTFQIQAADLNGVPFDQRNATEQRLAKAEAMRPFDLSKGPLLRVSVLRLADQQHLILFTMHHIISDGWSLGVLVREISTLYEAFTKGEQSLLDELSVQYADYAAWQRNWLQGDALGRHLGYWQPQLTGIPAAINLPTDRPRPLTQSFNGDHVPIALPIALLENLRDLSRREGVTLFMTLLAAFQTLLHIYSGQEDIVVGTPIANRQRSEINGLIGLFVNTLALRSNFSGDPTFRQALQRTRDVALGAYAHQDIPFEYLVKVLQPKRNLRLNPIFQVLFVLHSEPMPALKLSGLVLSRHDADSYSTRFDLECHLWESETELTGTFVYNTDLFDEATIARMIEHFIRVLEVVSIEPDESISTQQLLSVADLKALRSEQNVTESERLTNLDQVITEEIETNVALTPLEEVLAGIWSKVLGVEQVNAHDDFFDLGGHSLLMAQVIARVKEVFGVKIPLRLMFESTTIAQMAEHLKAALQEGQTQQLPPLVSLSRDQELPLSFAQQRLWFVQELDRNSAAYNLPMAARLEGYLNIVALRQALNEIVRRHEVLRTSFITANGHPAQVIEPSLQLLLPLVDLCELDIGARESFINSLTIQEAQRPFDLSTSPLLRVTLLRVSAKDHIALLTMHHIIGDGWSNGILIREIAALYKAYSAGFHSPLPDLVIQYADFAHWQRQWLQGELLESHLSYWKQQLKNSPTSLDLPFDKPRPVDTAPRGGHQSFALSVDLSEHLKALARQEGVTLFMLLLAAFKTLLYRYSGQSDIILGTNVANRNSSKTEDLIGFFVNMLVLRTDLSNDPSFRELLKRMRKVTLGAYAHQDLPFDRLVQELRPERSLGQTPLFQAVFSLQNATQGKLEFSDLTLTELDIDMSMAKYDLVLNMWESEHSLRGSLQYNTDLFLPATISKLLNHFENLLESIATSPDARLSALEIFSNEESRLFKKETYIAELDHSFSF